MHYVGRVDWAFADEPVACSSTSSGLARQVLVGPAQGAVHTELAVGALGARRLAGAPRALLRGGAVRARGRAHPRARRAGAPAGRRRLRADAHRHAPHAGRRRRPGVRWLSVNTPPRRPADARPWRTPCTRRRARCRRARGRRGSDRRSATRRRAGSATTTARRPQLEALRAHGPRPRPRAGRHGHRAPGLQRHLREDARRRPRGRRPADDVHGRLRARRRGTGARPPVRGDVRLPRGRGRGASWTASTYTLRAGDVVFAGVGSVHGFCNAGRSGCAGSRPRRRSRRPVTPTDGSTWTGRRTASTRHGDDA